MNQWKNRLIAFMYGRYGVDDLYYGLLIGGAVFCLLGAVMDNVLFRLLYIGCFAWLIFRFLSRNIPARRVENEKYKKLRDKAKNFFKRQWLRVKECRTHVYRVCPKCRSSLRLPRRKGEHTVVCPCCGHRLSVKILF